MNRDKLDKILSDHAVWVRGEGGERANLNDADLSGAALSRAYLSRADLRGADLSRANLNDAYLSGANLRSANLSRANLNDAYLNDADLRGTDLSRADLRGAYLRGANLRSANLSHADLSAADLNDADLRGADLSGAVGFAILTQTDNGYMVCASWFGNEWLIQAGCRDFTIAEARAHWGSSDYHTPSSGSRILHTLDWLEKQPTPEKSS